MQRLSETITLRLTPDEARIIRSRAQAEERAAGELLRLRAVRPWLKMIATSEDGNQAAIMPKTAT